MYEDGIADIESVEESEDLEALSDEDAGDYSNFQSQDYAADSDHRWRLSDHPNDSLKKMVVYPTDNFLESEDLVPSQHAYQKAYAEAPIEIFDDDGNLEDEFEREDQKYPTLDQIFSLPADNVPIDRLIDTNEEIPKNKQPKQRPAQANPVIKKQQPATQKTKKLEDGSSITTAKSVDLLIIGGGPAALGFMINAVKSGKLSDLVQNDGLAIIDKGTSFGGGQLCNYGINSNTSANGFVKSLLCRKHKEKAAGQASTEKGKARSVFGKSASNKNKPKGKILFPVSTEKKPTILATDLYEILSPKRQPLGIKLINPQVPDADMLSSSMANKTKKVTKPKPSP